MYEPHVSDLVTNHRRDRLLVLDVIRGGIVQEVLRATNDHALQVCRREYTRPRPNRSQCAHPVLHPTYHFKKKSLGMLDAGKRKGIAETHRDRSRPPTRANVCHQRLTFDNDGDSKYRKNVELGKRKLDIEHLLVDRHDLDHGV